jgi:flagellar hook-associated protein 2
MATGSITSLGIGSGLDLQDILDQLKGVDETRITAKENTKTELQDQVDAYNTVNAKLFSIKSDALNLSLASNFLENSVSVTDEDVLSGTVGDGYDESAYSVEVIQKAQRNSWESTAVASKTDTMFAEPESGIADHNTTPVTTQNETLSISYGAAGDEQQINVNLASGLTLSEITDEINNASSNKDAQGNPLVTASFTRGDNGDYYIRLAAASGGNSADSEINVAGFDWVAADTTVAITQDEETMYLSVAPGTTYEQTANLINGSDDNPGVTAAMINNGDSTNPYQLTLTSDDTGEDARISLTNLDDLTEVTGAGAQSLNAEFTVNGISYARQSNTAIDDVITGVTLDLKNEGEATLNIDVNHDTVKEGILSMIEGVNDLISYINNGTGTDEESADTKNETNEETDNPLDGSRSANRIVSQLKSLLTTVLDLDTSYTSLTDIGLEISKDGTVTIDEDALDEAIASDPDAIEALFLGNTDKEITGLADIINDAVTDMVSSTGIVSTGIDEAEGKITRIDQAIEAETERLTKKYDIMAKEFAQLDTYISRLNSEASVMTSMFESFNNANEK